MKKLLIIFSLLILLIGSYFEIKGQPNADLPQNSTAAADGRILNQARCEFPAYESMTVGFKSIYSKDEFEKAKNNSAAECLKIEYFSDGLKVKGFVIKPNSTTSKKYPVIIFNRGGYHDVGKINLETILDIHQLAYQGFVVIASQYRGNDGGEGKDEVGGADVRDVLNLIPLAKSLGYADLNNVFLYGVSRGGMQSFLALKHGLKANAVAVVGPLTDMESLINQVPMFEMLGKQIIPDWEINRAKVLHDRSAIRWIEMINSPVLILHGSADTDISTGDTLALAKRMQELGKPYQLTVFHGGNHLLSSHRSERDGSLISWFKKYMKNN